MTRKLEELFNLPISETPEESVETPGIPTTKHSIAEIDETIDKIDAALPGVRGLESSDDEKIGRAHV